jgi:hypothetical protein
MIDDLELLHVLKRYLRPAGSCELVVVVSSIDVQSVAARPQTAEAETAAPERRAVLAQVGIRGRDPRSQQNEVQKVPGLNG